MPVDYKRINAPENTVPYQLFSLLNTKSSKTKLGDLVKSDGTRNDGRKLQEQRKIFLKVDVVSAAKGSAYIELGETKVIVSVFDPREIPNRTEYSLKGDIYCDFKFAPFSCNKRRLHQQDAEEKHYSALMKQALESAVLRHEFPNFQVDVYALVLHNDGSALSAAITAAGLALANAGVAMYDLIASVELSIQGNTKFLDPTSEEEQISEVPLEDNNDDHGTVILATLNTHEQVSLLYQTGHISLETLSEAIMDLSTAIKEIVSLVEKCLAKYVIKSTANKRED